MDGIQNSNLNFVNKKLSVELNSHKDEEELIKEIIAKIDSIEPGLDIQVKDDKKHSIDLNSFEGSTQKQQSVEKVKEKLDSLLNKKIALEKQKLISLNNVLQAHSPLNILSKGYAIIEDENGNILKEIKDFNKDMNV